ncbi:MAG: site-specific DNA-methyltransferase [Saprospiraceae bacterium]|nr:site-specific DNA-methyltransferase [Saprospiraceae bacterium]MDW8230540.1 site-specific DNA-methyltransferase [Saprospiraceae bacterium]
MNILFNEDCIGGMAKHLPDACVDLVITDPPFGIDFKAQKGNYKRKGRRVLEGYSEVQGGSYLDFTRAWLAQVRRVLKPEGSLYVFSGWNYLKDLLVALDEMQFTLVNHLIWKYQFGVVTRRRYVTAHYHILYACIDDRRRKFFPYARFSPEVRHPEGGSAHYRDKEDVWSIPREYWTGDLKTPTKLPAEIIRKILAYSSEPGDLVLDPFLGSGQVAVVSQQEGRRYVGFEIVPEYFAFAQRRLSEGCYRLKAEE